MGVTSYALVPHFLGSGLPVVIIACNVTLSSSSTISSPIPPTSRPMLLASLYSPRTIGPRDSLRGLEFTTSG